MPRTLIHSQQLLIFKIRRLKWWGAIPSLLLAAVSLGLLVQSGIVLSEESRETEIQGHFKRAAEATERQDWKSAAEEYSQVIKLDPKNAEAYARQGMVYQDSGKLLEAVKSLERAMQLEPSLPRVSILLALNYVALGKYSEAAPYLEKAFGVEKESSVRSLVGQRLIDCYFALGEESKGLATVEQLHRLYPNDPEVLYSAAKVYANLWNNTIQQLLAKTPGSYQVHQVLAEVLEAQEKYPEAAQEYRQITKMEPRLPGAHYRLARMILRTDPSAKGDQDSLSEFLKELEISPSDVPTLTELGELHLRSQQFDVAARYFSQVLELQPSYVKARVGLAKVLLAEKQYQKAVERLEEALRLAPEDETIYYNLMLAYRSLGLAAEAQHAFTRFQELKRQEKQNLSSILDQFKGTVMQSSGRDR